MTDRREELSADDADGEDERLKRKIGELIPISFILPL
jgi:hypothetical protein